MINLIPAKFLLFGLAALFIVGVIGAGYAYVDNLQTRVQTLAENNRVLEIQIQEEKAKAVVLEKIKNDAFREAKESREAERQASIDIAELSRKLAESEYKSRLDAVRKSDKSSLYLRNLNSANKCFSEHFDDFTGKCDSNGRFKPIKE